MDIRGYPIFQSIPLLSGSSSLKVHVQDPSGNPASNVEVRINATTYTGIGEVSSTDDQGIVTFHNVPSTTIGILAKTIDNQISVNGLAGGQVTEITLKLMPLVKPLNVTTFGVSNGTTGWSGGLNPQLQRKTKRDSAPLIVSTNGKEALQSRSLSYTIVKSTKSAFIKYKFQTEEVPGGYFGTQYNDYFSITIRSDAGDYVAVVHSMNELGLGSFDSAGATRWSTLTLDLNEAQLVQFDVAVSNVADGLLQSQVIVDEVGGDECDSCATCETCPSRPACQEVCQKTLSDSCAFYQQCVESAIECGVSGYALAVGEDVCHRFLDNKKTFSTVGQLWMSVTERCMQESLVPTLQVPCESTCSLIRGVGFNSIPECYRRGGYCSIEAMDYVRILATVTDPVYRGYIKAGVRSSEGCSDKIMSTLSETIRIKIADAAKGLDVAQNQADVISLTLAKEFHRMVPGDGDLADIPSTIAYLKQVYDTAVVYKKSGFSLSTVDATSPNVLVLDWLRHRVYNDLQFMVIDGIIDPGWVAFAQKHGVPYYSRYPDPDRPTEPVGFDHFAAALGGILRWGTLPAGDTVGWLGDLFTFYVDWQQSGAFSGRDFALQYMAKPGSSSSFPLEDARQDVDAYNMWRAMEKTPGLTIYDAFATLLGGGYKTRFKDFVEDRFGSPAGMFALCKQKFNDPAPDLLAMLTMLTWEPGVKSPLRLSDDDLTNFCEGFTEVFEKLAGLE